METRRGDIGRIGDKKTRREEEKRENKDRSRKEPRGEEK